MFNSQDYLKKCLDSVVGQSLADIEIICINDGSTDKSLDILNAYKTKDNRFKVINQTNKGLSVSRNVGIENANGDYILFLDSDDWLDLNALKKLYNTAINKSCDLVLFKIINYSNKEVNDEYFDMAFLKDFGDGTFNWRDVKNRLFDISVTAPGKLFKKQLIDNIRFPEDLIFEDNLFFTKTIFNAEKIFFYDEYLYYRRIRQNSITNSYFDKFSDVIEIYNLIEDYVKQLGYYDEFELTLFYKKSKNIFDKFTKVDRKNKEEFFKLIKKDFKRYDEDDFKNANKRSLVIFKSALISNSYQEFEKTVKLYDKNGINRENKLIKSLRKIFK